MTARAESFRRGFRIVGNCTSERRLIDAAAAWAAYCSNDPQARTDNEAYLSAFQFDETFAEHMRVHLSPKGFTGPTWSTWLWIDLDRADPGDALDDARILLEHFDGLDVPGDDVLAFFSGSKGFHIGLPTALWNPTPGQHFHTTARAFAELLADGTGVEIDKGVYDRVRAFRAPNSRHPKTGLHKRRFTAEEIDRLQIGEIRERSKHPEAFTPPEYAGPVSVGLCELWQRAAHSVGDRHTAQRTRRETGNAPAGLNRATMELIRDGSTVATGDRHRALFAAAANLGEFGCPAKLAHALLTESGLDAGLPPGEVKRQIDCGLANAGAAGKESII